VYKLEKGAGGKTIWMLKNHEARHDHFYCADGVVGICYRIQSLAQELISTGISKIAVD